MKVLGKFLNNGAYKRAHEIEGFPKQVALVIGGYHARLSDKQQFEFLKGEHRRLSMLRHAGVPTMKARIMRVYNPHENREQWALIMSKMKASLHDLGGVHALTLKQWASFLKTLRCLAKSNLIVLDLQFLVGKDKVVVNDPSDVTVPPSDNEAPRNWDARVHRAEQQFKFLYPDQEIPR